MRKKPKTKTAKSSPKFMVEIKLRGGMIGYLTPAGLLDDDVSLASTVIRKTAEARATRFFNQYKRYVLWVKVVPAKK